MSGLIRFRRVPKPPTVECHFCGFKNPLAVTDGASTPSGDRYRVQRSPSQMLKGKYKEEMFVVDKDDFGCRECGEWNSRDEYGTIRSSHPAMYDPDFNTEAFSKRGKTTSTNKSPFVEPGPDESASDENQPFCGSCLRNQGIGISYRASYDPDRGEADTLDEIDRRHPPVCVDCESLVQETIDRHTRQAMKHVWRGALTAVAPLETTRTSKVVRGGDWRWAFNGEDGGEEWDGSILGRWDVLVDRARTVWRRFGMIVGRDEFSRVWGVVHGGCWVAGRILGGVAAFSGPRNNGILMLVALALVWTTRSWTPESHGDLSIGSDTDQAGEKRRGEWEAATRICILLKVLDLVAIGWLASSSMLRCLLMLSLVVQILVPLYASTPVDRRRQIGSQLRGVRLPQLSVRKPPSTSQERGGASIPEQRDPFDLKALIAGMEHTFAGLGSQGGHEDISAPAMSRGPSPSHSDDVVSMDWEPTPPQMDSLPSSATAADPWTQFSNPSSRLFQPVQRTGLEERFEGWSGFSDVSHSLESTESRFPLDEVSSKTPLWHTGVLRAGFMLIAVLRVILITVTMTAFGKTDSGQDDTVRDGLALAEGVWAAASCRLLARRADSSGIAAPFAKTVGGFFGVRAVASLAKRTAWVQVLCAAFEPVTSNHEIPAAAALLDGLCLAMDCACWVVLASQVPE